MNIEQGVHQLPYGFLGVQAGPVQHKHERNGHDLDEHQRKFQDFAVKNARVGLSFRIMGYFERHYG